MLVGHGHPLYAVDSRALPLIEHNVHRVSHAEVALLKKISHLLINDFKVANLDGKLKVSPGWASSPAVTESFVLQDVEEIVGD